MEEYPIDAAVHIVVKDVDKRRKVQGPIQAVIWHPLEQLTGYVVVQSAVPLLLDEVILHFQGIWSCRFRVRGKGS